MSKFVRIRDMNHIQSLPHESESLRLFARRKAQRAESAAVERAEERDEFLTAGVVHREFQRSFDRFGSAVREMSFTVAVDRDDLAQFFSELRHMPVIEICAA